MTIPLWVLLGFSFWTLITLLGSVGFYRWSQILSKRRPIKDFPADKVEGSDFYRRAMRAHMNCVENLPVYGALVLVLSVAHLQSPVLDKLAIVILAARILQTCIHLGFEQSNRVVSLRFVFFFIQILCMFWMGGYAILYA